MLLKLKSQRIKKHKPYLLLQLSKLRMYLVLKAVYIYISDKDLVRFLLLFKVFIHFDDVQGKMLKK